MALVRTSPHLRPPQAEECGAMRWPFPPEKPRHPARLPDGRLTDGDTVLYKGQRRWADLLGPAVPTADAFVEATQLLPPVDTAPLMTLAAKWRSRRSQR